MRIIFFGASELGWLCCRTLFEIEQDVVGIFSIPQQFRISWSSGNVTNVRFKSFEDLASEYSIPLIYVTKKMSDPEYREVVQTLHPDLLVVIGWYYMIPRSLRELAPLGAVGVHASLLPKYRGGAPLVWAIINGETSTGISLFHFADGVDDGDIIGQDSFEIMETDEITDVVAKSTIAAKNLVRRYIPLLAKGEAPRLSQDHSQATYVPQRKPEDGLIDWSSLSAKATYNWIRAQTKPYPGAFTYLAGQKVTIWRARLCESAISSGTDHPGTLYISKNREGYQVLVSCADGKYLELVEMQISNNNDESSIDVIEFLARRWHPNQPRNQWVFSSH